ncbi:MAG: glycosyltransferase [Lapillicoccus sp.]
MINEDPTRVGPPPTLVQAIATLGALLPDAGPGPVGARDAVAVLDRALDGSDELAMIAAVHALGASPGAASGRRLADLLSSGPSFLRDHAAWTLGTGPLVKESLSGLIALVLEGGFVGTLAQATLETFAGEDPTTVREALVAALAGTTPDGPRARLAETLGLVPEAPTTRILLGLAADDREAPAVRAATLAALGDSGNPGDPELTDLLDAISASGGALAGVARLARADLDHRGAPPATRPPGEGLTVGQLFLHADIDGSLMRAGQGDTGGIATLLVHLGDALLADPGEVTRVVTISRGRAGDDVGPLVVDGPGHQYRPVPFWDPPVPAAESWPLRVATRRAVRRILSQAHVDVLHLRMADVGSWAGAEAARDLGIPVVLTLAPDPHASVAAREADGHLSRADIGRVDEVEHLVFRIRLLQELQRQAARLVVFPRPALEASLRDLLGLDLAAEEIAQPGRVSTVPEGIDPLPLDRAAAELATSTSGGYASQETRVSLAELDALLRSLPPERRGLPLVVSVGRLHPVKGMATLVKAWAGSPGLRDRANLLLVGGDLDDPNADERGQLARIDEVVPRNEGPGRGLLLAGHRPNATVAVWLAAVRHGRPGVSAPGGIYVSASLKEEFGIAILEAMATGLVVVAPWEGGPATYVDDGVTGILADTRSPAALSYAVVSALDLASGPDAPVNAVVAERLVRERFSIQTMAGALTGIYAGLYPSTRPSPHAASSSLARP